MDKKDVLKLIAICGANYRNWPEPGKEQVTVALWERTFADVDFRHAQLAIEKFIVESPFPPTVADIRQRLVDVVVPDVPTGIEAWAEVIQAIRRYGIYGQEKAIASLAPLTRKVVEAIGFRTLCMSENEMADRAHFLKVYDQLVNRERKAMLMFDQTRIGIQELKSEWSTMRLEEGSIKTIFNRLSGGN